MTLPELVSRKRNLPLRFVRQLLKQRHLSPRQLAYLTGKQQASIINQTRPKFKKDSLTRVFPYPLQANEDESGPLFILVDEICLNYLKTCNK